MTDTTLIKVSELNRLRAELASGSFYKESDIDAMQDEIARLRAEVEKYRSELEALPPKLNDMQHVSAATMRVVLSLLSKQIREVLEGSKT